MNPSTQSACATLALRLLLDGQAPAGTPKTLDWETLARLAARNTILVRLAEALARLDFRLPRAMADAVARERHRIRGALEVVDAVSRECRTSGIEFLFPKVAQHWPDLGDDLDLLVLDRDLKRDRSIVSGLRVTTTQRDLAHCLSGSAVFHIEGRLPLDIQHGRLGAIGEHLQFPVELVRSRRVVALDGVDVPVASPDDLLLLQGMQRVFGRLGIPLCEVVFTITTLQRASVKWEYVLDAAGRFGIREGLSCYLSYVEQIHRSLYRESLVPQRVRSCLRLTGWGKVKFHDAQYRYPTIRVSGRLYARQFAAWIGAGNWAGVGRLCLVPVVGIARIARRVRLRPENRQLE